MCRLYFFIRNFIKYNFFYLNNKLYAEYEDDYAIIDKQYDYSNKIQKGSNVVIYGFGPYGSACFIELFSFCRINGIFDIKYKEFKKNNNKHKFFIEDPKRITDFKFDYIIISVMNKKARDSVIKFLLDLKVDSNKFVFINYKNNEKEC